MVSHKLRCIFIHISKCAGTTVEEAFGVDTTGDAQMGYGWSPDLGIHMQHATPDELLASGLVTKAQWETYYKFIIVRNPYARAYSDYAWVMLNGDVWGSFKDFINANGTFKKRLTERSIDYMGEHLRPQTAYFQLEGKGVNYDLVIRLEAAKDGFKALSAALSLPNDFFATASNVNKKKLPHYSWFYNDKRRRLVADKYREDLKSLDYFFDDKRPTKLNWLNDLILIFGRSGKLNFRLKYPFLAHRWGSFKRSVLGE